MISNRCNICRETVLRMKEAEVAYRKPAIWKLNPRVERAFPPPTSMRRNPKSRRSVTLQEKDMAAER